MQEKGLKYIRLDCIEHGTDCTLCEIERENGSCKSEGRTVAKKCKEEVVVLVQVKVDLRNNRMDQIAVYGNTRREDFIRRWDMDIEMEKKTVQMFGNKRNVLKCCAKVL